ncbi:hypothetical protein CDL60_19480 [Roseateles noduli]|nr:hypothetical protein CDL60_19480 [Roseateles noduli]
MGAAVVVVPMVPIEPMVPPVGAAGVRAIVGPAAPDACAARQRGHWPPQLQAPGSREASAPGVEVGARTRVDEAARPSRGDTAWVGPMRLS